MQPGVNPLTSCHALVLTCWEEGVAPLQTLMCRTCFSSLARAFSLSLKRLSALRSRSSSSWSRLCCLCKRASSPMVEPTMVSRVPPSCQRGRHGPPAAGIMVSCNSSSRMESCLMTAPCNMYSTCEITQSNTLYAEKDRTPAAVSQSHLERMKINTEVHQPLVDLLSNTPSSLLIALTPPPPTPPHSTPDSCFTGGTVTVHFHIKKRFYECHEATTFSTLDYTFETYY